MLYFVLLALAVILAVAWALRVQAKSVTEYTGMVVKVVDGDGVHVLVTRGRMNIRIAGFDAPEWNQPGGPEAKSYLKRIANGRKCRVRLTGARSYGRLIAHVSVGERDIAQAMVSAGHGWAHPRYGTRRMKSLHRKAQAKRLGLWAKSNPVAPWEWRSVQ